MLSKQKECGKKEITLLLVKKKLKTNSIPYLIPMFPPVIDFFFRKEKVVFVFTVDERNDNKIHAQRKAALQHKVLVFISLISISKRVQVLSVCERGSDLPVL